MRKTILLLLLFILDFAAGYPKSKPMKIEIEKIKAPGKETIILMALAIIEEKLPSLAILPEDYAITVWANEKEVKVKFKRLIRYKQKDVYYRYDLSVEVLSKKISPFDDWGVRTNFFVPNRAQKETIAYLKNLMGLPIPGMENVIYEDEKDYYITLYSKGGHSTYIINKETGEHLEPLNITYAAMPPTVHPLVTDLFPSSEQPTWEEIQ